MRAIELELRTVLVDILDILGTTQSRAVATCCVIVPSVKLIQDQSGAVTADILDSRKFWVCNDMAGRISGIRGQENRSTSSDLLCDLIRVNVIMIALGQRNRNG